MGYGSDEFIDAVACEVDYSCVVQSHFLTFKLFAAYFECNCSKWSVQLHRTVEHGAIHSMDTLALPLQACRHAFSEVWQEDEVDFFFLLLPFK